MQTLIETSGGLGNQLFQLSLGLSRFGTPGIDFFLTQMSSRKTKWSRSSQLERILPKEAFVRERTLQKESIVLAFVDIVKGYKPFEWRNWENRVIDDTGHLYDPFLSFNRGHFYRGPFAHPAYWQTDPSIIFDQINYLTLNPVQWEGTVSSEFMNFGLHIRRGDYKENPKSLKFHGLCGLDYYRKALSLFDNLQSFDQMTIFSDDQVVAKNMSVILRQYHSNVVIDRSTSALGVLRGMSLCDVLVGCNSTLSWWAANLGMPKTKVFPANWFLNSRMSLEPLHQFFGRETKLIDNQLILNEDILT